MFDLTDIIKVSVRKMFMSYFSLKSVRFFICFDLIEFVVIKIISASFYSMLTHDDSCLQYIYTTQLSFCCDVNEMLTFYLIVYFQLQVYVQQLDNTVITLIFICITDTIKHPALNQRQTSRLPDSCFIQTLMTSQLIDSFVMFIETHTQSQCLSGASQMTMSESH